MGFERLTVLTRVRMSSGCWDPSECYIPAARALGKSRSECVQDPGNARADGRRIR